MFFNSRYDFEHVKRVLYLILKGGTLWFTTTHPEVFHYYDEYWVSNDGVIKWHNEENHHDDIIKNARHKKTQYWCVSEDEKREIEKL